MGVLSVIVLLLRKVAPLLSCDFEGLNKRFCNPVVGGKYEPRSV
jgi:hypothetical protein